MSKLRCDTHFAREPLGAQCHSEFGAHHLHGDKSAGRPVGRGVNDGHATVSQFIQNFVSTGQSNTDHDCLDDWVKDEAAGLVTAAAIL